MLGHDSIQSLDGFWDRLRADALTLKWSKLSHYISYLISPDRFKVTKVRVIRMNEGRVTSYRVNWTATQPPQMMKTVAIFRVPLFSCIAFLALNIPIVPITLAAEDPAIVSNSTVHVRTDLLYPADSRTLNPRFQCFIFACTAFTASR